MLRYVLLALLASGNPAHGYALMKAYRDRSGVRLSIGNVYRDTVAEIVERARRHPYVGRVFREGLTAVRDAILARDPAALPGATSNQCYFCWWVLTRGLAAGVSGGGGQVGAWTGARPNATGDLVQVGLAKVRAGR